MIITANGLVEYEIWENIILAINNSYGFSKF
jgi:hypothetical protein